MLSNQSIKIQIFDLSIAKSIVHQYDFIQQIVQSNWSFFYLNRFVNNNTNQHLFIIYSTIFSTIARIFYSLQFEKIFEIYAFANQIDVFFSILFEIILEFVRSHFIYFICSTIFFNDCTSIFSLQFEIFDENIRVRTSNRHVFFVSVQKIFQFNFDSLVMYFSKSKFHLDLFTFTNEMNFIWHIWKTKMHDKMINNDHYDIDLSTINVVIDWTINKIDEHIQSMRDIYANHFQNWQMMLNFLSDIFENFDLKRNMRIKIIKKLKSTISKIMIEIAKLISIVANIDFFDATFVCDIQKFNLFCEIANFVQRFRQRQYQYRESDLLVLLFECFRNSALIWYKQQNEFEIEIVKKNLNEWLKILIIAFFTKSFANFFFRNSKFLHRIRLFFDFRLNIIFVFIVSRFFRHWFVYYNIFRKSFAKKSFVNIAKKFLIRKINFTNTFVNIMRKK